jgi:N-hydroxyarylamine O-acetyltransferase
MPLDLSAYLKRIGYDDALQPDHATLSALHLAHASHIPFENIDVLLGRPILLDLDSLQAKLVSGRRGGYCFEHNLLFSAVLQEVGFSVTQLAARVRYRTTRLLPRTHMLLLVELDGARWLVDVGFGGEGLLRPVPIGNGEPTSQFAWTYRVVEEGRAWVAQSLRDGVWGDLYAFTFEPQLLPDYEMASYYTSTHPSSRFLQALTVQLPTPEVRHLLRGRELIADRGGEIESRIVSDEDELLQVLAETFGLRFPAGTRIPGVDP